MNFCFKKIKSLNKSWEMFGLFNEKVNIKKVFALYGGENVFLGLKIVMQGNDVLRKGFGFLNFGL